VADCVRDCNVGYSSCWDCGERDALVVSVVSQVFIVGGLTVLESCDVSWTFPQYRGYHGSLTRPNKVCDDKVCVWFRIEEEEKKEGMMWKIKNRI